MSSYLNWETDAREYEKAVTEVLRQRFEDGPTWGMMQAWFTTRRFVETLEDPWYDGWTPEETADLMVDSFYSDNRHLPFI